MDSDARIDNDGWNMGGRRFSSRLILGTGKFPSGTAMREAIAAGGVEMVTVAIRRANPGGESLMDDLDTDRLLLIPNTSGAQNAEDAVRLARLARAAGVSDWVKVEITPDSRYLMPDPLETFEASRRLVAEGFKVMPYIHADPVLAKRLEEIGVVCVMPLGSYIGSNRGLRTAESLQIILESARVPVIVDAGLGAPSHAALAMELGVSAVMVNTAVASATRPADMAGAFRMAVEAGRRGFLAGLAPAGGQASASSPLTGFLGAAGHE